MNLIQHDSDQETDTLVDGAVAMLSGNADTNDSSPEKARMNESSAKKPRLTLTDMFPSSGKLPNFKKKADKLKAKKSAKKNQSEKPDKKTRAVKQWEKQPPRCKKFLVSVKLSKD